MVTEIPGKGRGLVAARDIEKGQLIFIDKSVIKLAMIAEGQVLDPDIMTFLKQQIESLPTEARAQYYKLTSRGDVEELKLEVMQRTYERLEMSLVKWSKEFRSNKAPDNGKIDLTSSCVKISKYNDLVH